MSALDRVRVTRYVTPLREGGSLPGIVEADDLARNRIQCRQPPAGAASDLQHAAGVDLSHEFSQRVRDGAGRLRHEPLRS